MTAISDRIDAILLQRRSNIPKVADSLAAWATVRQLTEELRRSVAAGLSESGSDDALADAARRLASGPWDEAVREAETALTIAQERLARDTINLGVSGAARVGKSTLLQAITGLNDGQIPTGRGLPVTAVRSRIVNDSSIEEATIWFHTWATFASEILAPLHASLGIPSVPEGPEAWVSVDYTNLVSRPEDGSWESNRRRVQTLQQNLPSFERFLGSPPIVVDLSELRPYVAYPTQAEIESGSADRRYAAVREVLVRCPFPRADAGRLGLIDLPGLGEIDPRAEAHHATSIRSQVDAVLLVKRASDQTSFWGSADGRTYDLVQEARHPIREVDDFLYIVNNSGGVDAELARDLRGELTRSAPPVTIFEIDASDPRDVDTRLLEPLLERLILRLPEMDQQVVTWATNTSRSAAQSAIAMLTDLGRVLAAPQLTQSAEGHLQQLAESTFRDIGNELFELVASLSEATLDDSMSADFVAEVNACYEAAMEWVLNEAFLEDDVARLRKQMRTDGAPAGPAELNRVRVEVSDRFAHIDQHFEAQVVGVARTVRDIYANSLGDLVPRSDAPLEDLRLLAARIRAGEEPAPNLADALDELSSVSFSYRTHLYPEVRRVIREFLSWTRRDPETGQLVPLVTVEPTDEGARQLMQVIRQQAQQVALHSRSELIRRAQTPALLTHAVTEHFADRVMRKGDQSRAEFQKVCRSYRDTIWPGEFEGFISVRKSSAAIRQTHRRLVDELDMLNQETQ